MSAETTEIYEPIQWRPFVWTPQREEAALVLARGGTRIKAAEAAHCNKATIYEWLKHPDFCAEIDRLSLMINISSRAERLRVAMRVARSLGAEEEIPQTEKDLLDWLKFAQSETDGAKIDLSKLAEMLAGESSGGPSGLGPDGPSGPATRQLQAAIDVTTIGSGQTGQSAQDDGGPEDVLNPS